MAQKAHVTSIETLDKLRVALLIFIEKATLVLDEVSEEVKRTRIWLQAEQGPLIARMQKQRMKELDMLQQELYTARMSALNETKTGYQQRVNKKRRQLRELEEKMRILKKHVRNFDSEVEPVAKKVEKLRSVIDVEMKAGVKFLAESVKSLEAYSEVRTAPKASAASAAINSTESETDAKSPEPGVPAAESES